MAYTAHVDSGRTAPHITVADDRGVPASEIPLPEAVNDPERAERHLNESGWVVTAKWTTTDEGWTAPVARSPS